MKILAIGDPHGDLVRVKRILAGVGRVDAILLTGDLGDSDLLRKLDFGNKPVTKAQWRKGIIRNITTAERLVRFLSKKALVYTVYGNIEYPKSYLRRLSKEYGPLPSHDDLLKALPGVRIINYRAVRVGKLRVGGVPFFRDATWARTFMPGNKKLAEVSKKETARAKRVLEGFGRVDVLLCHAPPYGILDRVAGRVAPKAWRGKRAGSKALLSYIKRRKPSLVLCGHIHEGKGKEQIGASCVINLGHLGYHVFEA